MSNNIQDHEEQQFTILQLLHSLEKHTETIARLERQTLNLRGFAELDANVGQESAKEDDDRSAPRECVVGGDECTNLHLTPCMHVICAQCANGWFVAAQRDTCPMCRFSPISRQELVQCPTMTASMSISDPQFEVDLLRCRLAEYQSMVGQVEAKLMSNVAPSFNTKLLPFLLEQVSELEREIARAVVDLENATWAFDLAEYEAL
jgi:hypothetical protein